MTLRSVMLNGLAAEDDLGLYVSAISGFHDLPSRTYQTVTTPLRPGSRPVSIGSTVDSRTPSVTFLVPATSFTDRSSRTDALAAMMNGLVELTDADNPNRVLYGYLKGMAVTSKYKQFVNPEVDAALTFTAFDPSWYERFPQIVNIPAGTIGALPIGTAQVDRIRIDAMGASTGPRIYLLADQTGAEVQRMTVAGNLTSSQIETVDCDAGTITLQDGSSVFANLTPGAFFSLRPRGPNTTYLLSCAAAAMRVVYTRTWSA